MTPLGVGVLVCLLGATATNLGVVLQKLSHLRNDRLAPSAQVPYFMQRLWIIGFATFALGQVCLRAPRTAH